MKAWAGTVYRIGRDAAAGYGRHAGSQLAAGISYRVLFSLVPLAALVVSVLDLVLPPELRRDIVDWLFHAAPGTELRSAVEKSVSHPGATAPVVGIVALAGLLWAASGMMGSIRIAFRVIWEQPGPAEFIKTRVPAGRIGTPEDIGNAVTLLCADEAAYINGVGIIVDGGHQAVCV